MFIQTESMPSSADLKFLPGREVLAEGTFELRDRTQAASSPLAQRLFAIPGVSGVFFGSDFITVTKEGRDWQVLKPAILGAIMEHFTSGAPVLAERMASAAPQGDADGKAGRGSESLRRVSDPELGYDIVGLGLVYDVEVGEGGVVRITMTTTTPGCPATSYLMDGARDAALSVSGVECVEVKLTHAPRWTPDMMSEEAKAHLGIRSGGGW